MFTQQNLKLAAYSLQKSGFTDHDCMEPFLRVRYGKPASYKGRCAIFSVLCHRNDLRFLEFRNRFTASARIEGTERSV